MTTITRSRPTVKVKDLSVLLAFVAGLVILMPILAAIGAIPSGGITIRDLTQGITKTLSKDLKINLVPPGLTTVEPDYSMDCTNPLAVLGDSTPVAHLTPEQMANGLKIVAIGRMRKRNDRDILAALMATLTEAHMRNLSFGDLDSLGLFQMQSLQGWGTHAQIMNTTYSINKFYAVEEKVPNRDRLDLGEIAQAVERSKYPHRYASREATARTLLESDGGKQAKLAHPAFCGFVVRGNA